MNESNTNMKECLPGLELSPVRKAEVRAEYDGGAKMAAGLIFVMSFGIFSLINLIPMGFINIEFEGLVLTTIPFFLLFTWGYYDFYRGRKWSYSTSQYSIEGPKLHVRGRNGQSKTFDAKKFRKINSVGKVLKFKGAKVPIEGILADRNPQFNTMIREWLVTFDRGRTAIDRIPEINELEAEMAHNARFLNMGLQFVPVSMLGIYILSHINWFMPEPLPVLLPICCAAGVPLIFLGVKVLFWWEMRSERAKEGPS